MSPWYTKRRPGNSRRFETFGSVRLGSEPFSVPGKQSGHTDVRQLHQGLDPALQTDGESAVGRHPRIKCFKVPLEAFGIYVPGLHGLQVCRFCMEPLSPGYQLLPPEEQVETSAAFRPVGVGMGVKRAFFHRIAFDKNEVAVMFSKGPFADCEFRRR
jgi:hypothetical protein